MLRAGGGFCLSALGAALVCLTMSLTMSELTLRTVQATGICSDAEALTALTIDALERGQLRAARPNLRRLLLLERRARPRAVVHATLAHVCHQLGDSAAAERHLDCALAALPADPTLLELRRRILAGRAE